MGQRQKLFAPVAGGGGEGLVQLLRDAGAAAGGELLGAFPAGDRQDAGDDRGGDPGLRAGIAEAEEGVGVEEELGDGARRRPASILRFSQVTSAAAVGGIGVGFGVGADADLELAGFRQLFDQFDRVGEAHRDAARSRCAPFGASPRRATISVTPASA